MVCRVDKELLFCALVCCTNIGELLNRHNSKPSAKSIIIKFFMEPNAILKY